MAYDNIITSVYLDPDPAKKPWSDIIIIEDDLGRSGKRCRAKMRDDGGWGYGDTPKEAVIALAAFFTDRAAKILARADAAGDLPPPRPYDHFDDYPTCALKGNPYRACVFCGLTSPAINGRLEKHPEYCHYRQWKTEHPGVVFPAEEYEDR